MSATLSPLPPSPLVYVVDDEPASAEVIAELLQLEGYQMRVFVDSRVAAQELLEDTGEVRTTGKRPAALYRLRYRDRPAYFPRTFSPRD